MVLSLVVIAVVRPGGVAQVPDGIALRLGADHQRYEARIREAATEAIAQYSDWFGPPPFERLTISTVSSGREAVADTLGQVTVPAHWLEPERSLILDAAVARGIARQWWGVSVAIPDQFLADGIADYAQSRTVERLYDRRHQRLAYSTFEIRYFGGLLPWAIRALRVDRQSAGIGRGNYRRHPEVDLRDREPSLRDARSAKVAAALVTLERYIGWPALQRGLSLAGERFRGRSMSAGEFARTIGDAADQNLSWFFDPLFAGAATWDYAIASVASEPRAGTECGRGPCVRSTVVVARRGSAAFTGTSHPPTGAFESGRAMEIELTFADGQKILERWDGRAPSKTIVFDGPSPVESAAIDPRQVVMLDLTRLNNTWSPAVNNGAAVMTWSVRWTVWLQDLLLTNAIFY